MDRAAAPLLDMFLPGLACSQCGVASHLLVVGGVVGRASGLTCACTHTLTTVHVLTVCICGQRDAGARGPRF